MLLTIVIHSKVESSFENDRKHMFSLTEREREWERRKREKERDWERERIKVRDIETYRKRETKTEWDK